MLIINWYKMFRAYRCLRRHPQHHSVISHCGFFNIPLSAAQSSSVLLPPPINQGNYLGKISASFSFYCYLQLLILVAAGQVP